MLATILETVTHMNDSQQGSRRYQARKQLIEKLTRKAPAQDVAATLDDVDFLNEDLLKQTILYLQKRATDTAFKEPGSIAAANDRAESVASGLESALSDEAIAAALAGALAPATLLKPAMPSASLPISNTADLLADDAGEFPAFQA